MTLLERFRASSFRGPGFDQIRLGAATIVLFHHCSGLNKNDIRLDSLFRFSGGYINFGFLAVAIFFAISGFLVTPSLLRSGNIIDFATRRILRIFPGLICVVFATMLILGPFDTILPLREYFTNFQVYRYMKNIATLTVDHLPGVTSDDGHPIEVNGSLWTLHFEVLCYAALALTSILGILHRRIFFLALFVISYGTNIGLGLDPAFGALMPVRFVTFMSLFVYFVAGATLFVYADRVPYSPILAIGIFALGLVTMPLGLGVLFVPICLSYLMVFLGLSALPGRSYLKHDLSYGVYLIHAPVLVTILVYFPFLALQAWWLVAVIVLSVTLVLAYLSWTYVEGPAMSHKKIVADWLSQRAHTLWLLRPKVVARD
jgi:peptidoglycan/LPS O-acetylase OafA/YrhL